MKPPQSPSRFRSTQRTYHRHQADDPTAWDNWVGTKKRKGGFPWKGVGIAMGIIAFAGLIALLVYQLR